MRYVVEALKVQLTADEVGRAGARGVADIEAYDLMPRGRDLAFRFTKQATAEAIRMFEKAAELDPGLCVAHAGLGLTLSADYVNGWNGATQATLERGLREAEIAVGEPMSHWGLAVASMWNKDLDRATAEAERTIALDPNSAMAYSILRNTLAKAGLVE